jgi:hypothetical protein
MVTTRGPLAARIRYIVETWPRISANGSDVCCTVEAAPSAPEMIADVRASSILCEIADPAMAQYVAYENPAEVAPRSDLVLLVQQRDGPPIRISGAAAVSLQQGFDDVRERFQRFEPGASALGTAATASKCQNSLG